MLDRKSPLRKAAMLSAIIGISACAIADDTQTDQLGLSQMSTDIDTGGFGDIAAVVVSRSGQIVYEDYFGGSGPDRLIDMRSVGKSITGLAAGIAIDEGVIDGVDTSVWPLFPQYDTVSSAKTAITLEDLLLMRSALDCGDWADSPGNEERMYRTRDWANFVLNLPLDPNFARRPDGAARFRYCTAGVFLIGQAISRQSRTGFDDYVAQRIFDPLGIERVRWRRSPSDEVQSGGQMRFRARDVHRIGQLVLNDGQWNGQQVIPKDWLVQMLRPRPIANADFGYGYLWWIKNLRIGATGQSTTAQMMIGNGGNIVAVLPDFNAVVVVQAENYNALDHFETSQAILQGYVLPALEALDEGKVPN